ncbi:MAG: efflux RND transporter permease subunit [Spirochaetes bacterium]|nr:efflux RND transporter permease subunit [Spirochaetota bacterium]MBN2771727.1 efflux RND transporter permease subunit [Spirochaetota bacterium]
MKKIIEYFIANPLIVNVITIFVLLSGFTMYQAIQKEGYPPVEEPGCSISAVYPGASPSDVELNVAMKIEEKIENISGIKSYTSTSYENYCQLTVFFENDEDYAEIRDNIRREIDTITDFPEEMTDAPKIHEWGSKYMDLMQIGIYSKEADYSELKKRYEDLKERIEELPHISEVEAWGDRDREIHIKADLDKLNNLYITFNSITEAIRTNNIQISAGSVKETDSEKSLITLSQFEKPYDINDVILRSNLEGDMIKLSDVAKVEDTFADIDSVIRFNGHNGFAMAIYKKEKADIITSVEAVRKVINDYRKEIGTERVGITVLLDNSEQTKSRLSIVKNNALGGLLLVALMLFLFLNFKNALWTVLGIPFSICFGMIFLKASGTTVNSVSLLAMIIVLGMIVDDAIVISENIHRHRILNGTGADSTVKAVLEVGFAVLTTILTTLVAFVPLFFMEGVIGSYVKEVPLVISLLLTGSLLESLFILPSHISHHLTTVQRILLGCTIGAATGYFASQLAGQSLFIGFIASVVGIALFGTLFAFFYKEQTRIEERHYVIALRNIYGRFLTHVLHFRYIALLGLFVILFAGLYLLQNMKFEMFPSVEANRLTIKGETKDNRSVSYTSEKLYEIEKFIETTYNKKTVSSYVSINGTSSNPEKFTLILFLTPESGRDVKTKSIIETLRDKFDKDIFENMNFGTSDGGPVIGNNVEIEISGNNDIDRNNIATMIEEDLKMMNGTNEVFRSDSSSKTQVQIKPRYEEMARLGISPVKLATIIRVAFEGHIVTYLKSPEGDIPYRLVLDDNYRNRVSTLDKLMVQASTRNLYNISSMITVDEKEAVTQIKRYNGKRTATIWAEFDTQKITANEIYTLLSEKYKDIPKKYHGIRINLGGAAELSNEALSSLKSTMIVAVTAIFVLLVFLFRSLSQPFIVIVAIPFGMLGVIFAFNIHGMPMSFMGLMGAIGLSGVVVNDSLIMVDYINQLKKSNDKKSLKEIVICGSTTRLRPIILTTATTFAGLLPTAYGIGGKDQFILPTAISLSWGLFFSTILVLILLPCFYLIEQDISKWTKRAIAIIMQ